MNLDADISWIRSELKNVRDPHLIEVFKKLLRFRKSDPNFSIAQYIDEIKEAEAQIEIGDYLTMEAFEQSSKKWD